MPILQEPNDMYKRGEYFYWDIRRIFAILKKGLKLAAARVDRIHSIGICTWGVDFALFDEKGIMVADPMAYRNTIGKEEMDKLSPEEQAAMFYRTGILSDKINSVFMIKGIESKTPGALQGKKLLMIPDILTYFFTRRLCNEVSEASTTQLLDVRSMTYSAEQCKVMGIDMDLFPPIAEHGTSLGNILPEIREEIGVNYDIPVICVPSHDTASAVLGAPVQDETFAFVSAGTWALIGLHCRKPVIDENVLRQGFTNEVGGFGRITLLKNSTGMFILQKLRADYIAENKQEISWDNFENLAVAWGGSPLLFDVNAPDFFNPSSMREAIGNYLLRRNQLTGLAEWPAIVSSAILSLAVSFAAGLEGVREIGGFDFSRVVIVGGGARSKRLNQLVADISGLEVVCCGMECSIIGNALAQAAFACRLGFGDLRRIAAASLSTSVYSPQEDKNSLLEKLRILKDI
ncbi:carbohydrate kinase [Spirochaetia bacterium]|nr:carbohydrate kinase [Spirochaetia bacterium]